MNIFLWILAGVLAAAFLTGGVTKLATPRDKLAETLPWTADATDGQVKFVGLVELLGAIGLILPAAFDIAPILVPLAATGLAITMAGAIGVHMKAKDSFPAMLPAALLGVLAIVVAIFRFGPNAF